MTHALNHHHTYLTGPGRWLTQAITHITGLNIYVEPNLRRPCLADPDERAIWVRPGLTFPDLHYLLGQATVHCALGPEWTRHPAITPSQRGGVTSAGAQIIPFPR